MGIGDPRAAHGPEPAFEEIMTRPAPPGGVVPKHTSPPNYFTLKRLPRKPRLNVGNLTIRKWPGQATPDQPLTSSRFPSVVIRSPPTPASVPPDLLP